jgi:hypothetical protein
MSLIDLFILNLQPQLRKGGKIKKTIADVA